MMSNITSVWQLGNTSFYAREFDETITLLTDVAQSVGETGHFLRQEIESANVYIKAYIEDPSALTKELLERDILPLRRFDSLIQYVQPTSDSIRLDPDTEPQDRKSVILRFSSADPYKYDPDFDSKSQYLSTTGNNFYISYDGDFPTPLEYRLRSYSRTTDSRSYSSTGTTESYQSLVEWKTNEIISLWKLGRTPSQNQLRRDGYPLPSPNNESGWQWVAVPFSEEMNSFQSTNQGITISRRFKIDYVWIFGSVKFTLPTRIYGYFKFTLPITGSCQYFIVDYTNYCQTATSIADIPAPKLYVWNRAKKQWEDLGTGTITSYGHQHFRTQMGCHLTPIADYLDGNQGAFLFGTMTPSQTITEADWTFTLHSLKYFERTDSDIVSILDVSQADYLTPITLYVHGCNNFNGTARITIYAADLKSGTRKFYPDKALHMVDIDGQSWSGNHAITFNKQKSDAIACRLTFLGGQGCVSLYDNSPGGIIYYEESPDGQVNQQIRNDHYGIISRIDYSKYPTNIVIRNLIDPTTEQRLIGSLCGELYHFNDSHCFLFNPFVDLSSSYYAKNGVTIGSNALHFSAGGYIIYCISPILPFAEIPRGRYQASGTINALIAHEITDTTWYAVPIYNSSWYYPLYNENCKLMGRDHFFIKLVASDSMTLTAFDIKSKTVRGSMGEVILEPHTTNPVNISAINLNTDMHIYMRWRKAYI